MIGCNGAGKSNLISFFKFIQQLLDNNLQVYVGQQGGPDSLLYYGRKTTEVLKCELYFGNNGYLVSFLPTKDNKLIIEQESFWWNQMSNPRAVAKGTFESNISHGSGTRLDEYVLPAMKTWQVYHFHDTSDSAYVKQINSIDDNRFLRPDARNLAAFLFFLQEKHQDNFNNITKAVQLVAPFFEKFVLRKHYTSENHIELEWKERYSDIPFKAMHLSDGTLRFICLATVLLQPSNLQPETIIVDEPELGLHPYAIATLASLLKSVSQEKQVIVSTQSVELLNEFELDSVIVVDREDGQSVFRKLDSPELTDWMDDYSLGEIWKKNLIGGRPSR